MTAPTYAYVEYEDGGKAIVSVSLIKDYQPNDVNDLACNKQVYWRQSGKGYEGEEGFYSGNVMVLGCEYKSIFVFTFNTSLCFTRRPSEVLCAIFHAASMSLNEVCAQRAACAFFYWVRLL